MTSRSARHPGEDNDRAFMLLLGAVMAASGAVVMLAGVVAGLLVLRRPLLGLVAGAGAAVLLATAIAAAWSRREHRSPDEPAR